MGRRALRPEMVSAVPVNRLEKEVLEAGLNFLTAYDPAHPVNSETSPAPLGFPKWNMRNLTPTLSSDNIPQALPYHLGSSSAITQRECGVSLSRYVVAILASAGRKIILVGIAVSFFCVVCFDEYRYVLHAGRLAN